MSSVQNVFIRDYLDKLNVSVTLGGFQRVWNDWRDMDYMPNYNKFYLIVSGQGMVCIDGKEYYPTAGQLVMMPAGVRQSYTFINENTYTKYWCHFTAKVGEMNLFDVLKVPCLVDVPDLSVPRRLFEELLEAYQSAELSAVIRIKAKLLELIAYYIDSAEVEQIRIGSSGKLKELKGIVDYIEGNLSLDITVESLAKRMHVHPNYFIRLFKKNMGITPIQYLINRRVEAAKAMLYSTDDPLTIIADRTGISDIYYLSRLFKEHTGFTPSEFRQLSGRNR